MTKPTFELSSSTYSSELEITSLSGTESISNLFKLKVDFKVIESIANNIDHELLIQDDIVILIKNIAGRDDYSIKGVFSQVEQEYKTPNASAASTASKPKQLYKYYTATLVPSLWRQNNNQSYDIFTNESAADILGHELSQDSSLKYCLDLADTYPVKEFICRYSESNFNFISRLAQHWGIFYFFDHDNDGELVLTDSNLKCNSLPNGVVKLDQSANPSLNYNSIRSLKKQFNVTPSGVVITESNPNQALELFEGNGGDITKKETIFNLADEGADNKDEADTLAHIRYEELRSKSVVFSGTTGLASMTPGFILSVATPTEEIDILIVSITHNGNYLDQSARMMNSGSHPYYECSFTGIPVKNQYRPKRDIKPPTIVSTTARVYSAADDQTLAQRNEVGRYQVTFDFMNGQAGKISNWIRHASHTARSNHLDMPLTPGTEVQIGFIGGNPNRPYILNALENSQSVIHPVTSKNPHHTAIITDGMLYTAALKSRQTLHITSDLDPATVKNHINNNTLDQLDIDGGSSPDRAIDSVKGDVHINRIYGNQYQWREGVDFNYGTNASFFFGSQYVENHASQTTTDRDIFDIKLNEDDLAAADYARSAQGELGGVAAPERLAGLVQKDWGNAYHYHEGYAYNWSSGPLNTIHKTFNFGGCYVENNTKVDAPSAPLDFYNCGFPTKPTDNDLITKTIGNTYDLQVGDRIDVHTGDVTSEMFGNTTETINGDTNTKLMGDTNENIIGNVDSTITGDVSDFIIGDVSETITGDTDSVQIGDQKSTSIGNIMESHIGKINSQDQGSENVSMGVSSDVYLGAKFDNFGGILIETAIQGKIVNTRRMNLGTGEFEINDVELSVRKTKKASVSKSKVSIFTSSLAMFG